MLALLEAIAAFGRGQPGIAIPLAYRYAQLHGYTYNHVSFGGYAGTGEMGRRWVRSMSDLRALHAELSSSATTRWRARMS